MDDVTTDDRAVRAPDRDRSGARVGGGAAEVGGGAAPVGRGAGRIDRATARRVAWRDALPWEGRADRGDRVLLGLIVGVIVLAIATMPLRPFLLASHPVLVEFVTGGLSSVGAAAAFARIGETSVWLVVVAGVVGMVKFDWLFWLAGRRWGERVVAMFAPGERARRFVARVRAWPPWVLRLVLVGAAVPGVPAGAVFALAGLSRVSLLTFLIFDGLGALLLTGLVVALGYGLGQTAVDVVLVVDTYASWIGTGIVVVVAYLASRRAKRLAAAA